MQALAALPGTPQVIFQQLTSDKELDVTPRMQIVDAVDTDADNRAELIFELNLGSQPISIAPDLERLQNAVAVVWPVLLAPPDSPHSSRSAAAQLAGPGHPSRRRSPPDSPRNR